MSRPHRWWRRAGTPAAPRSPAHGSPARSDLPVATVTRVESTADERVLVVVDGAGSKTVTSPDGATTVPMARVCLTFDAPTRDVLSVLRRWLADGTLLACRTETRLDPAGRPSLRSYLLQGEDGCRISGDGAHTSVRIDPASHVPRPTDDRE